MVAGGLKEHVTDYRAVVQQSPVAVVDSLLGERPVAGLGQAGIDALAYGAYLDVASPAANNEVIGDRRAATQVDDGNVSGLAVTGQ